MGAVTIPSTLPSKASAAAVSMARAAIIPDRAVGVPGTTARQPSSLDARNGRPGMSSRRSCERGSTGRSRTRDRSRERARSITSGSPAITRRAARREAACAAARTTISGPIPAGSPMVTTSVGRRAAMRRRLRSAPDLDVDRLLDPLVPAPVVLFELPVHDDFLETVLDIVELVVRFGNATEHLED